MARWNMTRHMAQGWTTRRFQHVKYGLSTILCQPLPSKLGDKNELEVRVPLTLKKKASKIYFIDSHTNFQILWFFVYYSQCMSSRFIATRQIKTRPYCLYNFWAGYSQMLHTVVSNLLPSGPHSTPPKWFKIFQSPLALSSDRDSIRQLQPRLGRWRLGGLTSTQEGEALIIRTWELLQETTLKDKHRCHCAHARARL